MGGKQNIADRKFKRQTLLMQKDDDVLKNLDN